VRALSVLFVAAAAVALVRAFALALRLRALDDVDSLEFAGRARDADAFVLVVNVVLGLVVLSIVPWFIVWCFRVAKNQEVLGRAPERLGAGWAVGGWFIPFANFVIPVLVIQDVWRGSSASIARGDPRWRIADRSWLVGWWWGLFVVAMLASQGSPADQRSFDVEAARGANLVAVLAMVCAATSAVLAILVMHRLAARQEHAYAGQLSG